MDDFNYEPKFAGGGDIYFNLDDGETKQFRIASPTHIKLQARKDGKLVDTKTWSIDDWKQATKDGDYEIKERFIWVVLVRQGEGESPIAQVMEQGSGVFKRIQALHNDVDWTPITETDLKITRKGTGLETRYEIVPSPKNRGKISDDEFAIADEVMISKYVPDALPVSRFQEVFGE